ncbi:CDF family Co(II)/Ni(II) efflux transporter DmeF [Desulfococcus multivorans]|uniref:Cation diffusion facilitator family transporter n=1 Tax=Desulfococcus multivorans DSM 2059 TaxID=1121405 RepID=S7TVS7_DESML|nr:CDF family Co(II)/Ni(II) efflux transporter DmeF [Desulfococcus multivorans]AOY60369.1 cation diffusion facilitator family transporter [Desulfococcus multivorans]AQV02470.1 cation transporter [Desulfococcus multivorans]EPR41152.1 cation diffusion facilitator family transporter [Desulfococcus multivorans DSM 2059]SJZ59836.1 cation diffusion facilitator family transporter [Desulfococcus multivorans DSM 2059]
MQEKTIRRIRHEHNFDGAHQENEKKTLSVIILTGITMLAEIIAGVVTGSMALLADGWHMGTHAFALGITYFAYVMARRFSDSSKFAFGTGKFGILSAYTSALFLGGTALYMIVESLSRFVHPVNIAFDEAILVAIIGFAVNLLSIRILHGKGGEHHGHDHEHDHRHDHSHHTHDHNLRAAYLHVIADALTSVLAIAALISGKFFGWSFLDPVMGIVGGLLIARWAWGLLRSSALILLDAHRDKDIHSAIVDAIESDGDSIVADLHVWPLNADDLAAAITVVSKARRCPSEYGSRLSHLSRLKHTTVETHVHTDKFCAFTHN